MEIGEIAHQPSARLSTGLELRKILPEFGRFQKWFGRKYFVWPRSHF